MEEFAKAWVFNGQDRALEMQEFNLPVLKKGEILVKNKFCTICKSDLHTFLGKRPGPVPSILGHEILGEIVQLSEDSLHDYRGNVLKKGDLITWTLIASCGKCKYCLKGIPQKCLTLKKYGHEKIGNHYQLTGGFASHTHLFPGTSVYKLQNKIDKKILAGLNCSWATVAAAIRNYGDVKGKNVIIFGAGMLGVVASMMCKEMGASNIITVEKNNFRLGLIRYFGTDYIIPATLNNGFFKEKLQQYLHSVDVDVIFEMTGANQAIIQALDIATVGTEIILAGSVFPTNNVYFNPEQIVRKLIKIKGVHNYTPEDLANVIDFVEKAVEKYPLNLLFEENVFNLETVYKALETAQSGILHRVAIDLN
jgi:putative phosphonate catabolism associated alcohol dehydrogenase